LERTERDALGGEAFPRACRILRRAEFLRIQGQGRRIHGRYLIFQFLPGRTTESRLGITASRKVGNAVARNRFKRWIRAAFRQHPELRPRRGDPLRCYDLVITVKRDVEGFSWRGIHDEIVTVLDRHLRGGGGGGQGRNQRAGKRRDEPRPRDDAGRAGED
jgi:ribonuclease P protein component